MTEKKHRKQDATPVMEWVLGIVGAVLFLSALVFLVAEGLRGEDRPGAVIVRVIEILPVQDAFVVRYAAYNNGSKTLADVHLSARVLDDGSELDSVDGMLDFLPGHSTRAGGFYLREDPRRHQLEIRVEGYQDP